MTGAELAELADAAEIIEALLAQITGLEEQLQAEQELSDHRRRTLELRDRRIAELESERFAR